MEIFKRMKFKKIIKGWVKGVDDLELFKIMLNRDLMDLEESSIIENSILKRFKKC